MRNLIYAINLSLDGCCDHTKVSGGEEMLQYYTDLMRDVDLIVYGRKTYELMIPYWPDVAKDQSSTKAEIDFAQTFAAIDKVVFSRSLDSVEGNTRIVRANPSNELLKLKQETGKKISIGGVSLPAQLIALGITFLLIRKVRFAPLRCRKNTTHSSRCGLLVRRPGCTFFEPFHD